MVHVAIGPDANGRWTVARALPGCQPLGVMDCPTQAIARSEADVLNRGSIEKLDCFEMYPDDVALVRELDENYGMTRAA